MIGSFVTLRDGTPYTADNCGGDVSGVGFDKAHPVTGFLVTVDGVETRFTAKQRSIAVDFWAAANKAAR